MSKVQSIIFLKSKFNKKSAIDWLKNNKYLNNGVDIKPHVLRFRQLEPAKLRKEGYNHYITKKISNDVSFIIAYKDNPIMV